LCSNLENSNIQRILNISPSCSFKESKMVFSHGCEENSLRCCLNQLNFIIGKRWIIYWVQISSWSNTSKVRYEVFLSGRRSEFSFLEKKLLCIYEKLFEIDVFLASKQQKKFSSKEGFLLSFIPNIKQKNK